MSRARLLVIGGYATAGKDAVANFLVSELGWYKTYMSKPLEKALLTIDPLIAMGTYLELPIRYSAIHASIGYDESKKIPEVRGLLQRIGTDFGRNMIDPDIWLDVVATEVVQARTAGRNVVVTGMRYTNELVKFMDSGAETLWVSRPGVQPVNAHTSDNTLTDFHFKSVCKNNGTLEDLRDWVTSTYKEL